MPKVMLNNLHHRIEGYFGPVVGRNLIRVGIGACTAVLLIIVSMTVMSLFKSADKPFELDQDQIALPSTVIAKDTEQPDAEIIDRINATPIDTVGFERLNSNKKSLTAKQQLAIMDDKPRYSLVIQMAGENKLLNAGLSEKLSKDVTLSVTPYLKNHNEIAGDFKRQGFEVWMLMATETLERRTDNGPFALSPVHNINSNMNALINQLQGKDYITGITFDEKSLMPGAEIMWPQIVQDLFAEGYAVHDATPIPVSPKVYATSDNKKSPYIKDNVHLNLNTTKDNIKHQLDGLKNRIKTHRNVIITTAIATPAALDILAEWVNSLEAEGIVLLPLSAQLIN